MILHRGSRKAVRLCQSAARKFCFEELENRRLLTTIHGGDVIEFINQANVYTRVQATGPASAQFDLIGSTFQNGNYVLNDIPTLIQHPDGTTTPILGGVGGAVGQQPIQVVTGANESITDLIGNPGLGLPGAQAPSGGIAINSLSSNSKGQTWGFNEIQQQTPGGTFKRIELVNINYTNTTDPLRGITPADAIVTADIAPEIAQITGAVGTTAINNIVACDFLPSNDNLLYFAVSVNVPRANALGGATATAPIVFLMTYDFSQPTPQLAVQPVNAGNPANADEFISDQANAGFADVAPSVQGFSFTSNDRLVAMVTGRAVGGRGDTAGIGAVTGLVELDPNNPVFDLNQITPITQNGVAVTDFHGLEVVPGDDDFVYGITGTGTTQNLLHVDRLSRPNALAVDFGPLTGAVSDLAWNPAVRSAFIPGRKGSLIAEEQGADQLDVIDPRDRFPRTDLYSIYGTNTTSANSISVAIVPTPSPTPIPRPMEPFTGTVGPFLFTNAQTGVVSPTITLSSAPGGALVGTRVSSTSPVGLLGPRRIHKGPSQTFGAFPKSAKFVNAGVNIQGDIDNVLIGGTVMGNVDIAGSANILYAGNWLTGDARGRLALDDGGDLDPNVLIGGDVRAILSDSFFGTTTGGYTGSAAPTYLTDFNVAVGGKLGEIRSIDSTLATGIYVSDTSQGTGLDMQEIEDRRFPPPNPAADESYFQGFAGAQPSLGDTTDFYNDTFATPQYLSTGLSRAIGNDQVVAVDGQLNGRAGDTADFYAVGLLAGQTVTAQLVASPLGGRLDLGTSIDVFDPDGRLIDSDLTTPGIEQALRGHPFQFTTDRPGAYRFEVSSAAAQYTLRLSGVADIALGAIVTGGDLFSFDGSINPVEVHRGDLGAFDITGNMFDISFLANTVDKGNLRSLVASSLGLPGTTNAVGGDWINFAAPGGSVGLVRNTDPAGICMFNFDFAPVLANNEPNSDQAIGGDYQLVDAAGNLGANILADRSIGTIRAASMTLSPANGVSGGRSSTIVANADQRGSDGVIDLIDDAGDFGTINTGGPHIFTGPGGNVRYIRVAGATFKSNKFGGGADVPLTPAAGETMSLTDDSGTQFTLSPTPQVHNTGKVLPTDPDFLNPGQLSVLTYATDDNTIGSGKGGVVVLNVTVTSPGGGNHGLLVKTTAQGTNGSVEIGTINVSGGRDFVLTPNPTGSGAPTINDPRPASGTTPTAPDGTTPLDIVFEGPSTVDAWSIIGAGNIDSIDDETPDGEIVNVTATGVADIAADWIGIAKSHTGVDSDHAANAVNGVNILDDNGSAGGNITPFVQQRNLIHIVGGTTPFLISARARRGIGNIWVEGIIGNIVADSNGKQGKGPGFDGIDGPIVATDSAAFPTETGRIKFVDIGQGINFGGRGAVAFAGIFASQTIEEVFGRGPGRDIRGPIVVDPFSPVAPPNPPHSSNPTDGGGFIGNITLHGGSIIQSSIIIGDSFNNWQPVQGSIVIPDDTDDPTNPRFDIGSINLDGNGGIIGSAITGPDIGLITIDGGFGFLNSALESVGENTIAGIDTTGYGIRGSTITGSENINNITVRGTGKLLDATSFEGSVAYSTKKTVDPFFHAAPNETTDIYRFLGLGTKSSKKKSISASGVIENDNIAATGTLNTLSAYQIRGRNGGETDIALGENINKVNVLDGTDEVNISAGALKQFTTGADVSATTFGISGPITRINVGGTLRGTSLIQATGSDGSISTITTHRGLFANIISTVSIGSIIVGTDLGSRNISTINNLDLLSVGGSIEGTTTVAFITDGQIRPFKKLSELDVVGNVDAGATIRVKTLVKQHVGGVVNGNIIVG